MTGDWKRFDELVPAQGQFIAAIRQRDEEVPIEEWEKDLERNAIGIWVDGEVWEGNTALKGFSHWVALPDRPRALPDAGQLDFWDLSGIPPGDVGY